jgi:PIN domain nuclease of toxin-antitoxin system
VASLPEIAIKHQIGTLQLAPSLQMLPDRIDAMNVELVAITAGYLLVAAAPEPLTPVPFDRLLRAPRQIENLRLITLDGNRLASMGGKVNFGPRPPLKGSDN